MDEDGSRDVLRPHLRKTWGIHREGMMKHVCAWCEKEGKNAYLGEVPGPHEEVTHGICAAHYGALDQALQRVKARRLRPFQKELLGRAPVELQD